MHLVRLGPESPGEHEAGGAVVPLIALDARLSLAIRILRKRGAVDKRDETKPDREIIPATTQAGLRR